MWTITIRVESISLLRSTDDGTERGIAISSPEVQNKKTGSKVVFVFGVVSWVERCNVLQKKSGQGRILCDWCEVRSKTNEEKSEDEEVKSKK